MSGRMWNLQLNAGGTVHESGYGSAVEVIERLLALLDELPQNTEGLYVQATLSEAKPISKAKP